MLLEAEAERTIGGWGYQGVSATLPETKAADDHRYSGARQRQRACGRGAEYWEMGIERNIGVEQEGGEAVPAGGDVGKNDPGWPNDPLKRVITNCYRWVMMYDEPRALALMARMFPNTSDEVLRAIARTVTYCRCPRQSDRIRKILVEVGRLTGSDDEYAEALRELDEILWVLNEVPHAGRISTHETEV